MSYYVEAQRRTLKAVITVGSRQGYTSIRQFSIDKVVEAVSGISKDIEAHGKRPMSAIITEGMLITRTRIGEYREKVYQVNLAWSPRNQEMLEQEFLHTASEYAQELGKRLKQERVYMDISGDTIVFRQT